MNLSIDKNNPTEKYIEIEENLGAENYKPLDIIIDKAQGVWVYDIEGNKYSPA
ncbi:MAG: hypothetical protein MZV70_70170 [Desulfobacterales bacterium]|nr:hypothetical protein [Desulfobacterales bacterium]